LYVGICAHRHVTALADLTRRRCVPRRIARIKNSNAVAYAVSDIPRLRAAPIIPAGNHCQHADESFKRRGDRADGNAAAANDDARPLSWQRRAGRCAISVRMEGNRSRPLADGRLFNRVR
jgi:hypothetical protein